MREEAYVFLIQLALLLLLLFLPIVIAFWRRHPNRWVIFIITVVFGATVLGWLVALVWSLHGVHRSVGPIADGGESGLNLFANDAKTVRLAAPTRAVDDRQEPSPPLTRFGVAWATEQIERLGKLRDGEHISQQEYDILKARVLKDMYP